MCCGDSRVRRGEVLFMEFFCTICPIWGHVMKFAVHVSWLSGIKPAVLGYWEWEYLISHVKLDVQCIVKPDFAYILLLSSGSKHYLIAIGRDKIAKRAFQVSQSDSSCLLAAGYSIWFWMRRGEFWEDQLCGRKGQGGGEREFSRRKG